MLTGPSKHMTYHELCGAPREEGCALCRLTAPERPPEVDANEASSSGSAQARRAEESLRVYQHQKQEVAALIGAALGLLKSLGDEERLRRLQDLLVKLAEDRFNLVVLGQFKRGKSSLMNALLGRDLLPPGCFG